MKPICFNKQLLKGFVWWDRELFNLHYSFDFYLRLIGVPSVTEAEGSKTSSEGGITNPSSFIAMTLRSFM